jgi:hypothetical protein
MLGQIAPPESNRWAEVLLASALSDVVRSRRVLKHGWMLVGREKRSTSGGWLSRVVTNAARCLRCAMFGVLIALFLGTGVAMPVNGIMEADRNGVDRFFSFF